MSMSESEFQKVKARYNRAKENQELWLNLWEEAYDYTQPNRNAWDVRYSNGRKKGIQVYDTTAVDALDSLVSKLQAGLTPVQEQWMKIRAGTQYDVQEKENANRQLERTTAIFFEKLHNSNFDNIVNEAYYDIAVGTAALIINESDDDNAPFIFEAESCFNYYAEQGVYNKVQTVFRDMFELPIISIVQMWPDLELPSHFQAILRDDPSKKFDMSEAVIYDKDKKKWRHVVWCLDENLPWLVKELDDSPWVVARWSKTPTEVYGRGPVLKSLPSIQSLNKLAEYELIGAGMAANPAWFVYNDGLMNPFNAVISPGALIPLNQSMGNSPPITALEGGGNIQFGQLTMEDLRNQINKLMFANPLGPVTGPVKSATEISIRAQQVAEMIGPAYGRLQVEWIKPIATRCLKILQKRGLIPKFEVDGKQATLEFQAPVTQGQKLQKLVNFQQMSSTLISTIGPQLAPAALNLAELPEFLAEITETPLELVKSPGELEALVQRIQQNLMGTTQPNPGAQRGVGGALGGETGLNPDLAQLETAGI